MKKLFSLLSIVFLFTTMSVVKAQSCANFYWSGTGLSVTFVDTNNCTWGSGILLADPRKTTWDFGDSTAMDTGNVVTHLFSVAGYYAVTMTCYDTNMTNSSDTTIIVLVGSPSFSGCASYSYTATNNIVSFTNTSTCPYQNGYFWDFGDGYTATSANPVHGYVSTGTYLAKLYVYHNSNLLDSVVDTVVVSSLTSNCASFTYSVTGNVVSFTNTSNCPSQNNYVWNFGDTTFSSAVNPNHAYNYYSTFTVTLYAKYGNLVLDSAKDTVQVLNTNCAYFSYSNTYTSFQFNSTSFCPNQGIFNWDFGDGNTGSGSIVNHTYANAGVYPVELFVKDSTGVDIDSHTVVVTATAAPTPGCASYTHSGLYNVISFQNTSTCTNQTSYAWNFGDGTSGSGANPVHTYNSTGTFYATLYVFDSITSLLDSVVDTVVVSNMTPSSTCASFTFSVNYNVVTFQNTSTCPTASQFNWIFGDGNYGIGQNPTNTYASTGTFSVTLAVLDSVNNFLDTVTIQVSITSLPPSCAALFTFSQALDSNGNPVAGHVVITDQSTGNNLSYLWNFGDGNTSTAVSPTHSYSGNGPYLLCLTVSDSSCNDTYCDTLAIDTNGMLLRRKPGFTIHVGGYTPPSTTGVEELDFSEINIYPNPFNDHIKLELNDLEVERMDIRLSNNVGQVIFQQNNANQSGGIIELNLPNLNSGVYILSIITEKGSINKKLIRE